MATAMWLILFLQKWTAFAHFQAFAKSRGEASDSLAWADLPSQQKRVFEAFSEVGPPKSVSSSLRLIDSEQLERRTDSNGKDRLVGCMEGASQRESFFVAFLTSRAA